MVLINIEALSTTELQYIAQQEGMNDWDSLERQNLIEALEELYETENGELSTDYNARERITRRRYINTLTDFRGNSEHVSNLPGVVALPSAYAATSIHVMLREPGWAHAYWNISPLVLEKLGDQSSTQLVFHLNVEIVDPSDRHKIESFDIEIGSEDREWNINIPNPRSWYMVRLMCRTSEGDKELCRSQVVTLVSPWWWEQDRTFIDPRTFTLNICPLITKGGTLIDNRTISDWVSALVHGAVEAGR
ncbi:DUF4912 domain-containing protein [Parasphaerochaeta coccoides]|uniref:DUF4912 domain-containing protein n=1 Tax=Parasphaerochaeta coccoides (strain ATCC BAA-1237 / DSM 17374 / SPN1) TaxID=760011 RepID=F4GKX3_PARC1|nr:DUF4912 domain-containing protein [Parasphaerochaeta coccoides]AEC01886.1 hypothetical protein Spico_0658 [Parasphaerochaeta coccoides DSM 17374]